MSLKMSANAFKNVLHCKNRIDGVDTVENKKIRAVEGQYFIVGVRVSQVHTVSKNVQKRASKVLIYQKNVHLKVSFTKKHAKTCKNVQKTCKNVQKRAKTCKNVHLKCFWILFKDVHCQGPCILRPCISRPYCIKIVFSLDLDCFSGSFSLHG